MTLLQIYFLTVVACGVVPYLVYLELSNKVQDARTGLTIQDVIVLVCLCFIPVFNVFILVSMGIMHLMEKYNHILEQDAEVLFKQKDKQK